MNKFLNLSSQCLPFTDLVSMQLSSFFIVPSPTVQFQGLSLPANWNCERKLLIRKLQIRLYQDDFSGNSSFPLLWSKILLTSCMARLPSKNSWSPFPERLPTQTHVPVEECGWEVLLHPGRGSQSQRACLVPTHPQPPEWRAQRLLYWRNGPQGTSGGWWVTLFKTYWHLGSVSVSLEIKHHVFNPGWPGQNVLRKQGRQCCSLFLRQFYISLFCFAFKVFHISMRINQGHQTF